VTLNINITIFEDVRRYSFVDYDERIGGTCHQQYPLKSKDISTELHGVTFRRTALAYFRRSSVLDVSILTITADGIKFTIKWKMCLFSIDVFNLNNSQILTLGLMT
jgi:hypothetical protein